MSDKTRMAKAIRRATTADLPAVAEIYNHAVINTNATYDLEPRDDHYFMNWLTQHSGDVFGAFVMDLDGVILGYSTLSKFTPREGYKVSAEVSTYVHPDWKGRGVGGVLMDHLIAHGRASGLYSLIGMATSTNDHSIAMIARRGFAKTGEIRDVAEKFDEVLDLHVYQLFFAENRPSSGPAE